MASTELSEAQNVLHIKQINLHHSKERDFRDLHTSNQNPTNTIVLVQETWIRDNILQGLDPECYNIFALPGTDKVRTCILASKSLKVTEMP